MKWLHNILKGASLTGALFVFQACYGIPQGPLYEDGLAPMDFSLVSRATGMPLEGIRVLVREGEIQEPLGMTGADGRCHVQLPYFRNVEGPFLTFEDPQGYYASKDTTLADLRARTIEVKLDIRNVQ